MNLLIRLPNLTQLKIPRHMHARPQALTQATLPNREQRTPKIIDQENKSAILVPYQKTPLCMQVEAHNLETSDHVRWM